MRCNSRIIICLLVNADSPPRSSMALVMSASARVIVASKTGWQHAVVKQRVHAVLSGRRTLGIPRRPCGQVRRAAASALRLSPLIIGHSWFFRLRCPPRWAGAPNRERPPRTAPRALETPLVAVLRASKKSPSGHPRPPKPPHRAAMAARCKGNGEPFTASRRAIPMNSHVLRYPTVPPRY